MKVRREVYLARPPDQGAGAALIFAGPGWHAAICGPGLTGLCPGPALGLQAHNGAASQICTRVLLALSFGGGLVPILGT